jgi:transposase-like protein
VIVLAVRWYLRFGLSYRDVDAPVYPAVLENCCQRHGTASTSTQQRSDRRWACLHAERVDTTSWRSRSQRTGERPWRSKIPSTAAT